MWLILALVALVVDVYEALTLFAHLVIKGGIIQIASSVDGINIYIGLLSWLFVHIILVLKVVLDQKERYFPTID